jgi:hypothetical protein
MNARATPRSDHLANNQTLTTILEDESGPNDLLQHGYGYARVTDECAMIDSGDRKVNGCGGYSGSRPTVGNTTADCRTGGRHGVMVPLRPAPLKVAPSTGLREPNPMPVKP